MTLVYTYSEYDVCNSYQTESREDFERFLLNLTDGGRLAVMDAFWEAMEVDGISSTMYVLAKDVIDYGGELYRHWVGDLISCAEDVAWSMGVNEPGTIGCITVEYVEDNGEVE